MAAEITHHTMTEDELALALDWAAAEGWNPGLEDAQVFRATDPDGFFVARADGQPVAAISVVNHGDDFAFLGLYLCRPDCRGQGIGFGLWQHALAHAGQRIVGLDGVPDQQENYRKSGFTLTGQTYRFAGSLEGARHPDIRPALPADTARLVVMEAQANGYAKPAFLGHWLTGTATRHSLVLGDDPRGFVTIRACREGHKIGPVIAADLADAQALVRAAIDRAKAGTVMIDVPDDCPALMRFCEDAGLSVSFNTARMYRGPAPKTGPGLRTIATMELG